MAGFDLAGLMQAATQQAGLVSNVQPQLEGIMQSIQPTVDSLISNTKLGTDARGDTPLSIETRKMGELDAQQRKQEFRAQIGDDPVTGAMISSKLADLYQSSMQKGIQQQQAIAEKQQVGLFDNPIQYLINAVTLPDERNAANATLNTARLASENLATVNKLMDERSKIENEYAVTLSKASVDSQATGAQADLNAKVAATQLQAYQSQAHLLQAVMSAGQQQVANIAQVMTARNNEEHLKLAQVASAQNTVRFKEWQIENKEKKDFNAQITEMYNRGAADSGLAPLDTNKVINLFKAGGDIAKRAQMMTELGYANLSTGQNVLGQTPGQVASYLQATQLRLPESAKYVSEVMNEAKVALKADMAAKPLIYQGKDAAFQEAQFNAFAAAIAKEKQASINYNDPKNPYNPPSTKVMGAEDSALAQTPLFAKVIIPQGIDTSDPQKLADIGIQAIKEGKLSVSEFTAGFTDYYQRAFVATNINKQFNKYGLPEILPQNVTAKMPIHTMGMGAILGADPVKEIKITDPVMWNNYMVRRLGAEFGSKFTAALGQVGAGATQPAVDFYPRYSK